MAADRPKQYLSLLDRPVLAHTLERLATHPKVCGLLVGIAPEDDYWPELETSAPKLLGSYAGGALRAHTVLNGLNALAAHAGDEDWVLVHDAARPCVRHVDIDRLIDAVADHPDGALLGLAVADTVKRADSAGLVIETVSRDGLWRALTPQLFRVAVLREALERGLADGAVITDEASAVEYIGRRPRLVAGHADNIKITVAGDLALAELYLKRQLQAGQ